MNDMAEMIKNYPPVSYELTDKTLEEQCKEFAYKLTQEELELLHKAGCEIVQRRDQEIINDAVEFYKQVRENATS